ncbi:ABC transporter ATP-binding protein [Cellulomonas alba]|uniref:ATP-binding cassette domain-containing protein n=1 Tax=Cellulomonas alba TaxID=3053467 RepID=A0ABT7SFT5_9CELL|nr:ATP-binding cassette domain-containing protein [Cellulomonas alba]MDM7854899.1 ATP-binding cassette domain-containing protein [Cellulomonas alba]
MRTRLTSWWQSAVVPRRGIAQLLPAAGWPLVVGLTVLDLVVGLLPVAFVLLTSVVVGAVPSAVEGGSGSPEWAHLVRVFLAAAGVFLLRQVLAPLQTAVGVRMQRAVDGALRERAIRATLGTVGIAPLEDQRALDALSEATREFDNDFHSPGAACAGLLALLGRYVQLVGYAVVVGVVASWWAAAALVVAVLVFRYGQRGGLRRYSTAWSLVTGHRRRATYLREVAMGPAAAKEMRVFGLAGWFSDRYTEAVTAMLGPVTEQRRRIYFAPYLLYTAIGLVVAAGVLVSIGRSAAAGDIGLTALALGIQSVVAAIALGGYYPESDVPTQYGMQAVSALRAFEARAAEVEAAEEDRDGTRGAVPERVHLAPEAPAAALRFEGVTFGYLGSDRRVLDGLDLELPAGLCTAIVGVNGAGKTTLVKLLTRLHEPTGGRITVDGTDLRAVDAHEWRRHVSVIFQDFVRYELSAADNIAFGAVATARTDAAVRDAAEKAGILDVVDGLPSGFETPLSRSYEGGADLSGGQWQRIAIARSLYALGAGARVLVLDEPTSALDVRAEAAFFERFVELTRGVTSVLISHRFSSVRHADRIVVVDGGRVVEQGTHDELLATGGTYARLFHLQAERFAAGLDADGNRIEPDDELTEARA